MSEADINAHILGISAIVLILFLYVVLPIMFVKLINRSATKDFENEMRRLYGDSYVNKRKKEGWK